MKHLLVRLRIIHGDRREIDVETLRLLDQLQRIVDHGERRQAKEVHLQQAHLFDGTHVVAGNNLLRLGPSHWNKLGQRTGRNHNPRSVNAGTAHQALQTHCRVDQLLDLRLRVIRLRQRAVVLQYLGNRYSDLALDHLRDAIDFAIRHIECASHVLDCRLGRHRVEGDDLCDLVLAVLALHILDHFAAPVHAEVDVDIGHRDTFRIEKALEQQLMLQRVDVRDLHAVGHQRSGRRTASRTHRNMLLPRIFDEVPHDHEVARELHLLDAIDLATQPSFIVVDRVAQQAAAPQVCHIGL